MPYTLEQLKKRDTYQKIADADKNELKKLFEDEEARAQISGSTTDAIQTMRSETGVILSYEDPENLGNTYPSNLQLVRVPIKYFDTDEELVETRLKKERKFSSFRPNEPRDSSPDVETLEAQLQQKILEYDDPTFSTGPTGGKLQQIASQEAQLNEAIAALEAKIAEL